MHLQRLQELIQHPERVAASDRDGLKAWCEKYPYAGAISMLLARASAVGGHMEQELDLLKAAVHGTYRQPLYDLLLKAELQAEAKEVEAMIDALPEHFEESVAESLPTEEVSEEVESPPQHLDPEEPLERDALIAAIGRTIEQEVEPDVDALKEERTADLEKIKEAVASPFAAWLTQRARTVGFGEAGTSGPFDGQVPDPAPNDAHALIERFIERQPRIGKLREIDSSVEDWAKESIMEDPTLVTETMARIYVKQGQISKARKAYRYLALKYPAKSTYFAAQLKKIGRRPNAPTGANE